LIKRTGISRNTIDETRYAYAVITDTTNLF